MVEAKAMKVLKGLENMTYEETLGALNLYSLQRRLARGDKLNTYKYLPGITEKKKSNFSLICHCR